MSSQMHSAKRADSRKQRASVAKGALKRLESAIERDPASIDLSEAATFARKAMKAAEEKDPPDTRAMATAARVLVSVEALFGNDQKHRERLALDVVKVEQADDHHEDRHAQAEASHELAKERLELEKKKLEEEKPPEPVQPVFNVYPPKPGGADLTDEEWMKICEMRAGKEGEAG